MNSTIKKVKGTCVDCTDGRVVYLTAGRCNFHYAKHRKKINDEKKKQRGEKIRSLAQTVKPKPKDALLELWFTEKEAFIACNPVCMECGAPIGLGVLRSAVAHIFPKAQFPSVRCATLNWLPLGATCGCHNKTHRIDTFAKMKVFPEAIRRYRTFAPQIQENHKYHGLFLDAIKKYEDDKFSTELLRTERHE